MNWINKIFRKNTSTEASEEELRSVYDDSFIAKQLSEPNQADLNQFVEYISSCWISKRSNLELERGCFITDEKGFRGIAINPLPKINAVIFQHYIHILKSKHLELGYILKMAEHKKKGSAEIYKYYLKPSVKLQRGVKAEQLFGNITIELKVKDLIPKQFSIVSSYYKDVNFQEVRSFEEWVNVVFFDESFNF